jgi:hypothetical protein
VERATKAEQRAARAEEKAAKLEEATKKSAADGKALKARVRGAAWSGC